MFHVPTSTGSHRPRPGEEFLSALYKLNLLLLLVPGLEFQNILPKQNKTLPLPDQCQRHLLHQMFHITSWS